MLRIVLRIQAAFYVSTGLWPLIDMESFETITGPKTDDWLVYTVGLLLAVIGVTLLIGTRGERRNGAVVFLGAATATSLALIDLTYALSGRISSIYLLDAAGEIVLLAVILVSALRLRNRP